MKQDNWCLYKHTCPNGKIYFGITNNLKKRWSAMGEQYHSCKRFYYAIRKFGWVNIKHEVLIENLTQEKAGELEKKYIKDNAYTIALAIDGKQYSSEDFSAHVHDLGLIGESHLQLIIGGSIGLAPEILSLAQEKISFSKMTFPHQLMRVILLEQIYRAYRIMNGEPYHK